MLSIVMLTNKVCTVWSDAFLVLARYHSLFMHSEVSPSFPSVDDPLWYVVTDILCV